jgi:putative Ca2+/H+ antiporter (TMEM165/GDT1 family)
MYSPGWTTFGMELFHFLPVGAAAIIAGIAAGLLLETERPVRWAVFAGAFVGLMAWSSTRWYVKPAASELAFQALRGVAAGALTFFACRLAARRREPPRDA